MGALDGRMPPRVPDMHEPDMHELAPLLGSEVSAPSSKENIHDDILATAAKAYTIDKISRNCFDRFMMKVSKNYAPKDYVVITHEGSKFFFKKKDLADLHFEEDSKELQQQLLGKKLIIIHDKNTHYLFNPEAEATQKTFGLSRQDLQSPDLREKIEARLNLLSEMRDQPLIQRLLDRGLEVKQIRELYQAGGERALSSVINDLKQLQQLKKQGPSSEDIKMIIMNECIACSDKEWDHDVVKNLLKFGVHQKDISYLFNARAGGNDSLRRLNSDLINNESKDTRKFIKERVSDLFGREFIAVQRIDWNQELVKDLLKLGIDEHSIYSIFENGGNSALNHLYALVLTNHDIPAGIKEVNAIVRYLQERVERHPQKVINELREGEIELDLKIGRIAYSLEDFAFTNNIEHLRKYSNLMSSGDDYSLAGQFDKAIERYRKAVEINPENLYKLTTGHFDFSNIDPTQIPAAYFKIATAFREQGKDAIAESWELKAKELLEQLPKRTSGFTTFEEDLKATQIPKQSIKKIDGVPISNPIPVNHRSSPINFELTEEGSPRAMYSPRNASPVPFENIDSRKQRDAIKNAKKVSEENSPPSIKNLQWYLLAAENGHEPAKTKLITIYNKVFKTKDINNLNEEELEVRFSETTKQLIEQLVPQLKEEGPPGPPPSPRTSISG